MYTLGKISLNSSIKRMVSGLICLMIVLATFPLHTLQSTVRAVGGDPINLTLSSADGSEVKDWMDGALADATTVQSAGDINITLTSDITVSDANNKMGSSYFFNFVDDTNNRFDGKTITIDGQGHTIKIDDAGLFFLDLKNCKVILKNITIDGGWLFDGSGNDVAGSVSRSSPFIYVSSPDSSKSSELLLENGATIQNCKNSNGGGGGIYIASRATLTMNDTAKISGCYAHSYGGGIENYGEVTMNDTATISGCTAKYGGGICNENGRTVTMNSGNIIGCHASTRGNSIYSAKGDAIYNDGNLYLPKKEFEFLTITLPDGHGSGVKNCGHNSALKDVMNYEGIYNNGGGTITENLNRKIVFVDSKSGSTVGSAYGKEGDEISVPDRPGYVFVGAIGLTSITATGGKFTLSQDMIDSAPDGVITVVGKYVELYTVQYICENKVVGQKSGCPVGTDLSTIISKTFRDITLDGEGNTTLEDVVHPGTGYTFSGYTYGNGQTYTAKTTTWDNLTASAVDGVITVFVNYAEPYTVQYICDGKVVGQKSGCSSGLTSLSGVIENTLSNITLDGEGDTTLYVAAGDAALQEKGYTFSNFTYGASNTEVVLSGDSKTTWDNLKDSAVDGVITVILNYTDTGTVKYVANKHFVLDKHSKMTNYSGVNLPVSGLQRVNEPKNIIFDFCGNTIHPNDLNVPFIQAVPGKHITICNLNVDGSGCK